MTPKTEKDIRKLAEKAKSVDSLVASLTEEAYLKSGQKVFVKGSMGQTNVTGVFKEESNGWAKVQRDGDGSEFWCLYHQVLPVDSGLNC